VWMVARMFGAGEVEDSISAVWVGGQEDWTLKGLNQ